MVIEAVMLGLDLAEMGMEADPAAKDSVSRFDDGVAHAQALALDASHA